MPLSANFGDLLLLHGYTLFPEPASPGDSASLTMVWQAEAPIDADYKIFVQLRDEANNTLAAADHQPYWGYVPFSTWPAGAVVQETAPLLLPDDLLPGSYNIYVGLYHPATGERLPLAGDTSGENAVIVGPLVVE